MLQKFTAFEYLLIDLANSYGHDKELFEFRIQWAKDNLHHMETLVIDLDNKERNLYLKACMTLRKVMRGEPTAHLVEFDACNSGMQIMSALTGCLTGAINTGMVNPNERADAYGMLLKVMQHILQDYAVGKVTRKQAKEALMTVLYGSKAEPKRIFGEDSPELAAFYEAVQVIAPGAWQLLQELLGAWTPFAKKHSWKLPDGFDAVVKVMQKVDDCRIDVDELGGASFTYEFYVNEGTESGISLAANVVHSCDGYVVRSMHRRCNYDLPLVTAVRDLCLTTLSLRGSEATKQTVVEEGTRIAYYIEQYNRSTVADVVILPHLNSDSVQALGDKHLQKLVEVMDSMLAHKPFAIITIHDAFRCTAGNVNSLRQHYINILADIADSELLSDLLNQLHGTTGGIAKKLSQGLGDKIRKSNYSLS